MMSVRHRGEMRGIRAGWPKHGAVGADFKGLALGGAAALGHAVADRIQLCTRQQLLGIRIDLLVLDLRMFRVAAGKMFGKIDRQLDRSAGLDLEQEWPHLLPQAGQLGVIGKHRDTDQRTQRIVATLGSLGVSWDKLQWLVAALSVGLGFGLQEIFASGTAAVISPIGWLNVMGTDVQVADGTVGPVAQKLYDTLYGMQTGTVADDMGWTYRLL